MGIVTPEAVVLAFETAGAASRLLAILIDLTVQLAALLAVLSAFSILGRTSLGLVGVFVGIFVVAFVYPVAVETLWRGKSVGKAALGLRVVTVEGAPVHFRHALVRGALGLIDFWISGGGVAILTVLVTRRNQRLGDLAAGTLVLRERSGARSPAPARFGIPVGWEAYAATIDVRALDSRSYEAVRALLLRAPTFDPATRDRLARLIATPVAARLGHQPPVGVSAEAFCACVAGRYQARTDLQPSVPAAAHAQAPTGAFAPPS
ncbi:MAG: RDD family protein [Acidimicrobiales bacterium]